MLLKKLTPTVSFASHPFQIHFERPDNVNIKAAISYHSSLYVGMEQSGALLKYKKLAISGLDVQTSFATASLDQKSAYAVLKVTINDYRAVKANIEWIKDENEDSLAPIKFVNENTLKQSEARVIIGGIIFDTEQKAGLPSDGIKTAYVHQLVSSHLIMANMVFNGIPVVYPVPICGGKNN
jgi:hypothetical protein